MSDSLVLLWSTMATEFELVDTERQMFLPQMLKAGGDVGGGGGLSEH